jgi:hypothetical protein
MLPDSSIHFADFNGSDAFTLYDAFNNVPVNTGTPIVAVVVIIGADKSDYQTE